MGEEWFEVKLWIRPRVLGPILVEKSTEASVWIKGRRFARSDGYKAFYPTLGEAIARCRKELAGNLKDAKEKLAAAQGLEAEFEHLVATGKVVERPW